jgi:hypothetical protein
VLKGQCDLGRGVLLQGVYKRNHFFIGVACLILAFTTNARAQTSRFVLRSAAEVSSLSDSIVKGGVVSPLQLHLYLRGWGNIVISLDPTKTIQSEEDADLHYFQGSVHHRGRAANVQLTSAELRVFQDYWEYNLKLSVVSRRGVTHYILVRFDSSGKQRLIHAPHYILKNRCGFIDGGDVADLSIGTEAGVAPGVDGATPEFLREVEIAVEFDTLYGRSSKKQTRADLVSLFEVVGAVYREQLGVSIALKKRVHSDYPRHLTDANKLLSRFVLRGRRSRELGRADAYLHMTGKNLNGNTIGLAYLGVVCSHSDISYALIQELNEAVDHIVVSHELAHLFGARHDQEVGCGAGIMSAFLSPSIPYHFSECTKNIISSYIKNVGSCLNYVLPPAPTPFLWGEIKASELRGGVQLPVSSQDCQVEIRAATNQKKIRSGVVLTTLQEVSNPKSFEVPLNKGLKKGVTRPIYIGAVSQCGQSMSPTVSPQIIRVKASYLKRGRKVSLKRWYRTVAQAFHQLQTQ